MSGGVVNEESTITSIVDLSKKLETAGDNVDKLLQLLNSLNQYSVNLNILKVTKVGKKMSKLSQHKVPAVSKSASELVAKWKKEIKGSKKKETTYTEVSSQAGKDPAQPSQGKPQVSQSVKLPGEEAKAAPMKVREADVEYEQTKQEDNNDEDYDEFVSENYTNDSVRQNIRKGIMKQLIKYDANLKKKATIIAIKIENGLIKAYGLKRADYSNKSRTILANLMRSNEFKMRIMTGGIKPEDIATMDPKEMQDESLKKKRDEMEKDIVDAKRSDFMLANMTLKEGMYVWGKCKSKKTTFYEQQTRSADEPMTTFVQCLECGHNMKF